MTPKLSEYLERHGNGTVDIERSVKRLRDLVERRRTLEQTVSEVMAEVLNPLTHRVSIWDLTAKVLIHPKMVGFESDNQEVPDIIRHTIKYNHGYSIVKGTRGGIFKEKL